MDTLYHREEHFRGGETVKDIVIGMSDGLTVPFALAAGISGAISAAHLVVTAGFAEIAAGSIAMGLGGYLAARSDRSTTRANWRGRKPKSGRSRRLKRKKWPSSSGSTA